MGSNGFFAIGQLEAAGTIDYDIAPPLLGVGGARPTPLSTNGYVIAASSEHPAEAWELVEDGRLDEEAFRQFTFENVARLMTGTRLDFFAGTVVEDATAALG